MFSKDNSFFYILSHHWGLIRKSEIKVIKKSIIEILKSKKLIKYKKINFNIKIIIRNKIERKIIKYNNWWVWDQRSNRKNLLFVTRRRIKRHGIYYDWCDSYSSAYMSSAFLL